MYYIFNIIFEMVHGLLLSCFHEYYCTYYKPKYRHSLNNYLAHDQRIIDKHNVCKNDYNLVETKEYSWIINFFLYCLQSVSCCCLFLKINQILGQRINYVFFRKSFKNNNKDRYTCIQKDNIQAKSRIGYRLRLEKMTINLAV